MIAGSSELTVEVTDFARGMPFLKREMLRLVSPDGVQELHIRMQSTLEEQGPILGNLAEYLEPEP